MWSTGGMPNVSQTDGRPSPQYLEVFSGQESSFATGRGTAS